MCESESIGSPNTGEDYVGRDDENMITMTLRIDLVASKVTVSPYFRSLSITR